MTTTPDKTNIFISRTSADADAAVWMARALEADGFKVYIQDRDFDIGAPFPEAMRKAYQRSYGFICLMSRDYWEKPHCMKEWDSAYSLSQKGEAKFLPVMVRECALPRLDDALAYLNLVDVATDKREAVLVAAVRAAIHDDRKLPDIIQPDFRPLKNTSFFTPNFTGRTEELGALEIALWREGRHAAELAPPTTLHGLGGIGKSAIAREYARQNLHRYAASWLVRAENPASFNADMAAFAHACSRRYNDVTDAQALVRAAIEEAETLAHRRGIPVLFVLDNVEASSGVPRDLRRPGIHLVVTSRVSQFAGDFETVEIRNLSPDSTKSLFLARSGREDGDGLDALIAALDGLPLAIIQAAGYLAENPSETYDTYLANLHARLGEAGEDFGQDMGLEDATDAQKADAKLVLATYLPSIEQAEARAPGARNLFIYAAFFAADDIPLEVLARRFEDDLGAAMKASDALMRYSLWSSGKDTALGPTRNMHRLLQTVLRGGLAIDAREELARLAAEEIRTPDPGHAQTELSGWPKWQAILPHALALSGPDRGAESPELAVLLNNCGSYAENIQADYRVAEPLYRRALAIDEASFGPDHPKMAIRLNNLAGLLRATNRHAEAEPLYRRVVEIDEASYGPDHPNVATDLNNLAGLLRATNRLSEAEPLYRRALAIGEASFGPDHPNVAIRLNNLALLLKDTNRLSEAEPLHRRVVEIFEKAYGPDHPNVASGLNNLAGLLKDTNRHAEAEPLYQRALVIDERSYGPDHPNVAIRLNNLAELLRATNRLEEAIPLYRRSKAIFDASLPDGHPTRETIAQNLAIAEADWAVMQKRGGDANSPRVGEMGGVSPDERADETDDHTFNPSPPEERDLPPTRKPGFFARLFGKK